jgi:hypothetical protein
VSKTALFIKHQALSAAWYADYLSEVLPFIAAQPQITTAALVWAKGSKLQTSHK